MTLGALKTAAVAYHWMQTWVFHYHDQISKLWPRPCQIPREQCSSPWNIYRGLFSLDVACSMFKSKRKIIAMLSFIAFLSLLPAFTSYGYADSAPLESRGSQAAVSADPFQTITHHQPYRDHDSIEKASPSTLSPLLPRVIINLPVGNHWQLAVDTFHLALPAGGGLAAEVLIQFYQDMEAHALLFREQYTTAPLTSFAIGNLRLDFYCALGHIPWPFIRSFAALMRTYSERGWVGLFKAQATHLSGVSVFIRLHLEQVAAAAR